MRVRIARITDADNIAVLCGQLGYPSSAASVRRRLHSLAGNRGHAVWVAEPERSGPVVGWIHVFVKQLLESDREAEIGGLAVDEAFRGRGAGKALVERAERWARAKGLKSVYLRSNIVRKGAHRFYRRLGYEVIKTQHAFRKQVC